MDTQDHDQFSFAFNKLHVCLGAEASNGYHHSGLHDSCLGLSPCCRCASFLGRRQVREGVLQGRQEDVGFDNEGEGRGAFLLRVELGQHVGDDWR